MLSFVLKLCSTTINECLAHHFSEPTFFFKLIFFPSYGTSVFSAWVHEMLVCFLTEKLPRPTLLKDSIWVWNSFIYQHSCIPPPQRKHHQCDFSKVHFQWSSYLILATSLSFYHTLEALKNLHLAYLILCFAMHEINLSQKRSMDQIPAISTSITEGIQDMGVINLYMY